ncbi:hypothetical protein AOLI_G00300420 [Acnodon oligacanthus]
MTKSQESRDFPLFNAPRPQRTSTAKQKSLGEHGDLSQAGPVLAERVSSTEARLSEAESRISTLDASAGTQQTAIAKPRGELVQLRTKVDDLESRSRRKNLRIAGLPEKAEGSDLTRFLREMLPAWLELPADLGLEIERAHRTPTALSGAGTTPSERHGPDFSAEVMRSRREFEVVKKALAAKHILGEQGLRLPRKAAVALQRENTPAAAQGFLQTIEAAHPQELTDKA